MFKGIFSDGIIEISPIWSFSLPNHKARRVSLREQHEWFNAWCSRVLADSRDEGMVSRHKAEAAGRHLVNLKQTKGEW